MAKDIRAYIDGCATCQSTKNITNPTKEPLHPTELATKSFEIITSDLITGLPKLRGYNSIMTIMDTNTKTLILEPCTDKLDADGAAEILL